MTRMTGPDYAVMCNLINIHTYSLGAENERIDAGRDGRTCLSRPNS